jgi:hypothetical protein
MSVFEIFGQDLESIPQQIGITNQNATGFERLEQPFVRIERERIGEMNAPEEVAATLAQDRSRPVCAIHVKPHFVFPRERRDFWERIDRARVRGPGAGNDASRTPAGGAVLRNGSREILGSQSEIIA